MKREPKLTAERARELFRYEPETGHLIRILKTSNRINLGVPVRAKDRRGSPRGESLLKRTEMSRGVRLEEFMLRQRLPTPSAGNLNSAGRLDEWGGKNPFRGTDIGRLHLNPSFVEEIMGFTVGYTALEPLETP